MRLLLWGIIIAGFLQATPLQQESTKKAVVSSLTGCIDQQDGQYVLTKDTDLEPIARLEPAAGSADDNFARHVGHKVTVKGRISKEGALPVMTVKDVETVAKGCAPAPSGG